MFIIFICISHNPGNTEEKRIKTGRFLGKESGDTSWIILGKEELGKLAKFMPAHCEVRKKALAH